MGLKTATKVDTNRVELEVEVDAEAFNAAVNKAYKKNISKLNVPGFRKGKAPRQLVEKIYGSDVFYDDAINDLYPTALSEAIDQSEYEYVDDKVDFDIVSVGEQGLVFKAVITVKPEVEVGKYKGLKAKKKVEAVTEDDIDAEISKLRQRNARLVDVEDRPAQNGDMVTFDFEGFVDGVAFDGGKAENYNLKLGSNQFIPGFEDQIVGKSKEEEFDVNVTFPEDYHTQELAGKPAVFKCKLHEIKTEELPELNDEFAKDVSEFDTLDELKANMKSKLEHEREHAAENAFESELMDQIVGGLKAEIPNAMFENQIDDSVRQFEQRLSMQGLNIDTYLQYTGKEMDELRDSFRESAEKNVKIRLALEKIAQTENITPTDEEIEEEYNKLAEQYKIDVEKIKSFILKADLSKDLSVSKALQYIKDNAVIEK
ncbi:MAG: trigger factor [Oscillospiraceae bacterium]|nr:trigger factor [Oscillospiraceae bacterium]